MADERLIDTILTLCAQGQYSTDDGKTFFQGQSLSALVSDLRDRGYSISRPHFFTDRLVEMGFKVIKARPKKYHGINETACRAVCTCITV